MNHGTGCYEKRWESPSRDKNLDLDHLRNVPKKSMGYQERQASFQ